MDDNQGYVELPVYNTILRIVTRLSARLFVGLPVFRDEEWLHISEQYTGNVFTLVMILRMLPKYLHSVIVWLFPSSYKVHHNLRRRKQIIGPIVQKRRNTESHGFLLQEKPNDMLQWMMDAATEDESKPDKLAHRQLVLTLGAIHTTTMAATHVLLDLCAHPEYLATLTEEVDNLCDSEHRWEKSTLTKLVKMDSFLKESQRFNPPNIFAFNRVAMEPLKLSDGVTIPKGTHFVVPSADTLMDPTIFADTTRFDPLRFYRRRLDPNESKSPSIYHDDEF